MGVDLISFNNVNNKGCKLKYTCTATVELHFNQLKIVVDNRNIHRDDDDER